MLIINDKSVTLKLSKKFYSAEAIRKTMGDFKEMCESKLSDKVEEEVFEVSLEPKENTDLQQLGLEFANYCLGMMK